MPRWRACWVLGCACWWVCARQHKGSRSALVRIVMHPAIEGIPWRPYCLWSSVPQTLQIVLGCWNILCFFVVLRVPSLEYLGEWLKNALKLLKVCCIELTAYSLYMLVLWSIPCGGMGPGPPPIKSTGYVWGGERSLQTPYLKNRGQE